MKRLLLLLACLLALCTTVVAAEPAISDMKTDCTLTGSGACQVTQTFTMEIDGAQTQLRFPLVPGAKKASVAGYDAQKQTDGDCPVLVLSDASGFTGTRSFTVLYTVSGLVSEADGVQTLQLPLLSAKWAYPISRYQFTVTMPKPFEGYPAFVSGYYSDVISDYIDLDVSESLISGTIATGLKDHESLDMTLTLDKSYFSGAYTALSFSWVGMAVIVALLALAFGYWFVTLRSAPIRTSTRRLPPDAALLTELLLRLLGRLLFRHVRSPLPLDLLHRVDDGAAGGLHRNGVPLLGSDQGLAEGRLLGNDAVHGVGLLRAHDLVGGHGVAVLVRHRHLAADGHHVGGGVALVHDHHVLENLLQLREAAAGGEHHLLSGPKGPVNHGLCIRGDLLFAVEQGAVDVQHQDFVFHSDSPFLFPKFRRPV